MRGIQSNAKFGQRGRASGSAIFHFPFSVFRYEDISAWKTAAHVEKALSKKDDEEGEGGGTPPTP